jgi:hypothetical protein
VSEEENLEVVVVSVSISFKSGQTQAITAGHVCVLWLAALRRNGQEKEAKRTATYPA